MPPPTTATWKREEEFEDMEEVTVRDTDAAGPDIPEL
ncbi:hypothetical protein Rmet_6583 [Cupriavidus metallidurans CH34]|jgi:hypothetical protein|uniref:Uncharacterized protein n=1 Tax=Cupriavidus metallidurans (strain ATCC 43123 / DSM 2839 / NBRC 102507 / CH34) TaxID=266264 RepID=D3DY14_CUPMC|nr:hypothetical protein Rmet_6583 [Cupriavidus metallidurans CH34]